MMATFSCGCKPPFFLQRNKCHRHVPPFGGGNPKDGVNHVFLVVSFFHVFECFISSLRLSAYDGFSANLLMDFAALDYNRVMLL